MKRPSQRLSLVGVFPALCGCVAISSAQTADTLGAGRLQVGLEPGVAGVIQKTQGLTLAPAADVAVRYGATERLDVGGRLGQSGLELQLKVMLTAPSSRIAVSIAPHLGGQLRFSSKVAPDGVPGLDVTGTLVNVGLPLLLGLWLGQHQLVVGPRGHLLASVPSTPGEQASRLILVGGSIGVCLRISRAVAVMPEVAMLVPMSPTPVGTAIDTFTQLTGGLLVQTRLAFLLGDFGRGP